MNLIDKNIEYLDGLLKPLLPYYDKIGEFGDWESGQGANISWFEMFARSSYGIFAYTAAVGDNVYIRKFNETIHKAIRDKRYAEWCGGDQKAVELLPILAVLLIHKDKTWDTYSSEEKNALLAYFGNINKIFIGGDNWQFFRIIVTRGINELGGEEDEQYIIDSWKIVEECYCGDGWYRDGKNCPKDYYVAFGYHYYSLLYRYLFPKDDKCELIKERAWAFAKDYQYFFDAEGRMIVYGRSMIYRFASLAFWSVLLCNDDILDGTLRARAVAIIDKSLDWWKKQSITDNEGLVTLGIAYRNEQVCEDYNSAGSPYWMMKAFAFMLADRKKVQIGKSTSIQEEKKPEIKAIANGDVIVVKTKKWNTAFINSYKGASYVPNNTAKYMRFAYNSMTGFNLSREASAFRWLSDDNSLVFDIAGIKHQREKNNKYIYHEGYQEFEWQCGDLIKVRSYVIPRTEGYIRVHIIRSKISTDCYESGFAQPVSDHEWKSLMSSLYGGGQYDIIQNQVNSNIYSHHTQMPVIKYRISKGINMVADYTYMEDTDSLAKQYNVRIEGGSIRVSGEDLNVQLKLSLRERVAVVVNNMHSRGYQYSYSKILSIYQNTNWLKQMYRKVKSIVQ